MDNINSEPFQRINSKFRRKVMPIYIFQQIDYLRPYIADLKLKEETMKKIILI